MSRAESRLCGRAVRARIRVLVRYQPPERGAIPGSAGLSRNHQQAIAVSRSGTSGTAAGHGTAEMDCAVCPIFVENGSHLSIPIEVHAYEFGRALWAESGNGIFG